MRVQYTNTDCLQHSTEIYRHNSNIENDNKINLKFMGHNINGLEQDNSKPNLLVEYCSNKGTNIIGICETNRNRKQEELWNKNNLEYTSFWTNKDNKKKGSGVCIIINKKWEKHIRKINKIDAYYIESCDYNITFVEISFTDIIVTNNRGGRRAERSLTRILYDYENTTNEQWNEYKRHFNSLLEKHNAYSYIEIHRQNEDMLNKLWDIIWGLCNRKCKFNIN
ncbi:hypothetical protein RclHR1_22450001 [Rhizophagus clarus]|uniref:Endonuclease/exonuclease/phosphatase domain-containing protein n=1 Tax=Rhizophagus clarus TaxID=94130 RepID=A0A2Z6RP23_9GLOM|nr:hypothetical protein RclHR1_22450001 [Rhizophagus clarus]